MSPLHKTASVLLTSFTLLCGQATVLLAQGNPATFNVTSYGAVPNDSTDDTAAVRSALAAAEAAGGGVVYFPAGTYRLAPTSEGGYAFTLNTGNLTFLGDGADTTILSFRAWGGLDPAVNMLNRGGAFYIDANAPNQPINNVTFRDLRVSGNTLPTANAGDLSELDGWDVTHKGITIFGPVDGLLVEDTIWDGWRGEMIYSGGGTELGDFTILRSTLFNCNASAVSMTGGVTIEDSTIYNVYNAVENFAIGADQFTAVRRCLIEPNRSIPWGKFGIAYLGTRVANLVVTDSTFGRTNEGAVFFSEGAHDALIQDNTFLDGVGVYAITLDQYPEFAAERGWTDIRILDNLFIARNNSINQPVINIYSSEPDGMLVEGNTASGENGYNIISFMELPGANGVFNVSGNTIGANARPLDLFSADDPRPTWANNTVTGQYDLGSVVFNYDTNPSTPIVIAPTWSRLQITDASVDGKRLTLTAGTVSAFPEGFLLELRRTGNLSAQNGVVVAPENSWNSLSQSYSLYQNDVLVLRKGSSGKFDFLSYNGSAGTPPPPAALTANAGNNEIILNWTASPGATSYKIYAGTSSGSLTFNGLTSTTTSAVATGAAPGTVYYYRVRAVNSAGESGPSNLAFSAPNPAGGSESTLFGIQTPPGTAATDSRVVLGMRFSSSEAGQITKIRYYKPSGEGGTHEGKIWSNTGTQLAAVTFTGETSSGWQEQVLASPLSVTAGTTYVVSVTNNNAYYTGGGFTSAKSSPPLTAPADNPSGNRNGVYGYATSGHPFPTNTYNASNYWRDVVFVSGTGGGPTIPAAPSSLAATAASSTQINLSWVDNSSDETGFKVERKTGAGGTYAQIATVGAGVTTYPNIGLAASTQYYYRVRATNTAGDSAYSNEANATTQAPPGSGSVSLLSSQTPSGGNLFSDGSYELGMRFRSLEAGEISAIRYYHVQGDAGAHTGKLWASGGGTALATVSFPATTSGTPSGWIQANLATPYSINANTVYVVSVNNNTHYPASGGANPDALSNQFTSGSVRNETTGNGVFNGTPGSFPTTASGTNANYYRDVVFTTGTALPSPWTNADIGSVGVAGSTSVASGTWTVKGSGADIWGTADGFQFVSQPATGDCEIITRVVSSENTDTWAKAGAMIRESTAAGSRFAMVQQRPDKQVNFQWRSATSGSATSIAVTGGTANVKFLRLVRSGNNFTASYSTTSATGPWTALGSAVSIPMASGTRIGLAVTSHNNSVLNTSVLDNVTVTP